MLILIPTQRMAASSFIQNFPTTRSPLLSPLLSSSLLSFSSPRRHHAAAARSQKISKTKPTHSHGQDQADGKGGSDSRRPTATAVDDAVDVVEDDGQARRRACQIILGPERRAAKRGSRRRRAVRREAALSRSELRGEFFFVFDVWGAGGGCWGMRGVAVAASFFFYFHVGCDLEYVRGWQYILNVSPSPSLSTNFSLIYY